MNILFNYIGFDGAGRIIALSLAKSFKRYGGQVYAVLGDGLPGNEEWIKEFGSDRVYFVSNYKDKDKVSFVIKTLDFYYYRRKFITKFFDGITFDYTLRPMYHHWAYMVDASISRKSIITICHSPIMHSDEKQYFRFLFKQYILQSDRIIVFTESYLDQVERIYGYKRKDLKYVPLGLLDTYANYLPHAVEPPYQEDAVNFLFFGLIRGYKGLHVLAKAFREVVNVRNNVTLRVVGAGDLSEYRKDFDGVPNVYFENRYVEDSEVSSYFSGPNVVTVLPYTDANQSGVIQVAYLYEVPVIASDVSDLQEQLDNGNIGIFFKARDVQDLVDKMISVIDNPDLRTQQKKLMHQQREKLDWDNIGKELLDFMDE